MEDRIKKVMASVFKMDPSQINEQTAPGNVEGWDSLVQMQLVVALEEEFGIRIDEEELAEMVNYRLVVAIISSYIEE